MLILSRKEGESIEIPELGVVIEVTSIKKSRITIGIEAPKELAILRGEIVESASATKNEIADNEIADKVGSKCFAVATAPTVTIKESSSGYAVSDSDQPWVFQVA